MRASNRGILLTKAELKALLEFALTDAENKLSRVRFHVAGDRCRAYASDGHRAVEADGEADDDGFGGEWHVERDFLAALVKLLDNTSRVWLRFSGASLHEAELEDDEGHERGTVTWPHDAAVAQLSIDALREVIKLPTRTRKTVRCVTISPTYLASVALVGKAAGWDQVDLYPPETRDKPVAFRVEAGPLGTQWTGVIMPRDKAEEEDDEAA